MPDANIIFGGTLLPVLDIEGALAASTSTAGLYLTFTVVDPIDGTMTFALGGPGFDAGGTRVYPCVTSWGPARKFMTQASQVRDSDLLVDVAASAWIADTTGTWRDRLYSLIRNKQLRGIEVTVYQWVTAFGDSGSVPVWHGYWNGYQGFEDRGGALVATIRLTSKPPDFRLKVSDVVTTQDFALAPQDSIGQMIPRAYGRFFVKVGTNYGTNWAAFMSRPVPMVRGVVIDDSVATLKTTVRFCKNDGTSTITGSANEGTTLVPELGGSFWVFVPQTNSVALLDAQSVTNVVQDADSVEADIAMSPVVYVPLQPSEAGGNGSAGLTDLSALFDDDLANYVETTSSDYSVSANCPAITISGAQVKAVYVVVDVENVHVSDTLTADFGLYNASESGGPTWFNSIKKSISLAAGSGRQWIIGDLSGGQHAVYGPQDFANSSGDTTYAECAAGRFIGRDATNNEVPAQCLITVTSGTKANLRVYGIGAVVRLILPAGSAARYRAQLLDPKFSLFGGDLSISALDKRSYQSVEQYQEITGGTQGLQYLLNTWMQADDGAGTYTGTSGALIEKGCDIAAHLLDKIGGFSINRTSGTVGNFIDARSEDTEDDKILAVSFGPEVTSMDDAIRALQARHPIRLHDEDGVWNCVYEEMNPHSSRFYRSTSDIVKISARRHILSGSFRVDELPYDEIVNTVSVNYGHGYGDNRPTGTVRYQNPLSVSLFGQRDEVVVDEPWIVPEVIVTDPPAATYLAHHLGRVRARPRLIVSLKLSQAFWDLKRGHVVMFDDDMESAGLHCPAYRCGRLEYASSPAAYAVNYSDSLTPRLMSTGSLQTMFGASFQPSWMEVHVPGSGTYTTVANGWKYLGASGWTPFSNVTRSDGGNPLEVFKASAGTYRVAWDMPDPWDWIKSERTDGVTTRGPCYFWKMDFTGSATYIIGTGQTTLNATWGNRLFEAIEVTRKGGALGDYPYVDVVLQEVM